MTTTMVPSDSSKLAKEQHQDHIRELESSMKPPLRKVLASVRKWEARGAELSLRRTWALGKQLKKVHDEEHYYGAGAIATMAEVLGWARSTLDKAIRFYLFFPEKKLEQLLEARMKTSGAPLNYSHVEKLTTIELAEHRDKMLAKCVANDWTPEELAHHIQVHHRELTGTVRKPHAGGRPAKVPGTIVQLLHNFEKTTGVLVRNDDIMYTNDLVNFSTYMDSLPADRVTPELLKLTDTCLLNIDKAMDVLRKVKPMLMQARLSAEIRMKTQAAAQGKSDADVIDAEVVPADKGRNGRKPKLLDHKASA